ncbi:MAG: hypothetical protein M5U34_20260 [Chloroflexi bacterium]|nr:hypothetical protein [Chloroflexota bacterium]
MSDNVRTELEKKVIKAHVEHAIFRWESATTIAATIIAMVGTAVSDLPFAPAIALAIGLTIEGIIVASSLTDQELKRKIEHESPNANSTLTTLAINICKNNSSRPSTTKNASKPPSTNSQTPCLKMNSFKPPCKWTIGWVICTTWPRKSPATANGKTASPAIKIGPGSVSKN